ncbi:MULTISPECIES: intradiol ring-cleavage dioxygenase [unclassified Streptomyces]|uniref:intradiol ring-cleavage dioxygenase n=1 Tax=unclassified Streptomyces TaxID=2593676 RepID=UPI0022576DC0|nr:MULTISPECIES: intradiol ring-cleavage dioxygenase [unclassified Streptomyces]MCX5332769.1 intradiol ring-cleavage dioxygenase [Streptomyces sp. NBC_00140]MCX5362167.1 intradiol ring-cleavage dioxygenase [Streptomyces sp. NBC_00124]
MTANHQPQEAAEVRDVTRRKVVAVGAGAVAAAGLGGSAYAASAGAGEKRRPPAQAAEECYALTSETTEGPYYIDADKIRRDVTEDRPGIPFLLRIKVIDNETCRPVRNAAVDIWHCDAVGVYSGYEDMGSGGGGGPAPTGTPTGTPTDTPTGPPPGGGGGHQEPTDDTRYLRGTWRTDRQGFVTFKTVFPGWYRGRTVHIHVKVHVNGEWTDAGYEGGNTCHTGQFFFDEESVIATTTLEPYVSNAAERTTLDEDTIYDGSGTAGGLLKLRYRKDDIGKGVRGSITVGVDPEATNGGQDSPPPASASASPSAG